MMECSDVDCRSCTHDARHSHDARHTHEANHTHDAYHTHDASQTHDVRHTKLKVTKEEHLAGIKRESPWEDTEGDFLELRKYSVC